MGRYLGSLPQCYCHCSLFCTWCLVHHLSCSRNHLPTQPQLEPSPRCGHHRPLHRSLQLLWPVHHPADICSRPMHHLHKSNGGCLGCFLVLQLVSLQYPPVPRLRAANDRHLLLQQASRSKKHRIRLKHRTRTVLRARIVVEDPWMIICDIIMGR